MSQFNALRATPNSSRILNLLELGQADDRPGDSGSFFNNKMLNNAIIQKSRLEDADMRLLTEPRRVVTKLFVAFDPNRVDDGGKYLFLSQKNLDRVFVENFGFDIRSDEDARRDFEVLKTLDRLPSLDPFLLREQFRLSKFTISDYYFRINSDEYQKIRAAVIEEFAPMVKAAFGSSDEDGQLTTMIVDRMWESSDLGAIKPLIESFGIDFDQSSDVFFSWKGFIYYKIILERLSPQFTTFLMRLKNAVAVNIATPSVRDDVNRLRECVLKGLRDDYLTAQKHVAHYNEAYQVKMLKEGRPGDFAAFLQTAYRRFEAMGACIASLDHAMTFWHHRFTRGGQDMVNGSEFLTILNDFYEGLGSAPK